MRIKRLSVVIFLLLAVASCSRDAGETKVHSCMAQGDGYQLEFQVRTVGGTVESVSVRGPGIFPLAHDGITRDQLVNEFEAMIAQPGRWERTEIYGNRIRFSMGYIGMVKNYYAKLIEATHDSCSIRLLDEEGEDVSWGEPKK